MSMELLDIGNGMMISGPTYPNSYCNIMMMLMNNNVASGCIGDGVGGVGQSIDDGRSKVQQQQQQQPFESVTKSPDGIESGLRGMSEASSSSMGVFFPFTNAQWNELERQAMVFKYMMHSIPIPYDLLFPFISSPPSDPLGLMKRSDTNLLKLLKNGDPEPGRCRRTDGKKWRCANVVAIDQKYCEKHVHRGRPRSRKHVEASNASDLNKIHKKPCLAQAQIQSNICPQNSVSKLISGPQIATSSNHEAFQCHLRNEDLSNNRQWKTLMQFQQAREEDVQEMNLFINSSFKKPTSVSNIKHDLVSLGLSMGHESYDNVNVSECETKQCETHDWLGQLGGPLGEVLRPPLTPSSTTTNGVCVSSSVTFTGVVLQEAIGLKAGDISSAPSTFSSQSESELQWFNQDKLLKQSSI